MKSYVIFIAAMLMGSCLFPANASQEGDSVSPKGLSKLARVASFRSSSTELDFNQCNMRATEADIPQIMGLYAQFDADDCLRLLLFPIEVREDFLAKAVKLGRIFVSKNNKGRILAFCKAFIVDDKAELQGIVVDELRAMNTVGAMNTPTMSAQFVDTGVLASDFGSDPNLEKADVPLRFGNDDVAVYFGGSFTAKKYRDLGINFALEQYALQELVKPICAKFQSGGNKVVHYLSGVVESNFQDQSTGKLRLARFRTFTELTRRISLVLGGCVMQDKNAPLHYLCNVFRAYKPEFCMQDGKLEVLPDCEENAGYGLFLSCKIK